MSSKFCNAVTSSGRSCRNFHMKDEKYCYQHKKKLSPNIFHGKPALQFNNISFNDNKIGKCTFKNKYGEYICDCDTKYKLCDKHTLFLKKFTSTISKLLNLTLIYRMQIYTLDSFMKLYFNLFNYMIKHKEKFVYYSMDNVIQSAILKHNEILLSLINRNVTPLAFIIHKNSIPITQHINKMKELKNILNTLRLNEQIKNSRKELINSNINIHMLSEIYIKTNSKDICPVFCKGIDKHILSFVVGNN